MDYLCLLYRDEAAWAALDDDARAAYLAGMDAFARDLAANGALRECRALEAPTTATTLRTRDGASVLTDGPFAESKEVLVGYYVLAAPHLDAAIALARRAPAIAAVATEIRPVAGG